MSLSINDFSKYTNDIQVHKVKKSNLPSKVTGKHMYFIDNEDGTYSVGVSASDGTIKVCSDNTDKLQEQINVLNGNFAELQISTVNGWNIVSNEAYCTVSGKLMKFYVLATSGTTDSYTKVATIEGINAPLQYFNIYSGSTCVGQGYISENCICIMSLSQSTGNIRFEGTVVIR